jgi:hypothetical protein
VSRHTATKREKTASVLLAPLITTPPPLTLGFTQASKTPDLLATLYSLLYSTLICLEFLQ